MKLLDIKQLFKAGSDRAVSPVIGVILMVAITVILSAVIATFLFGLGNTVRATPQASFAFDYDNKVQDTTLNDTLKITHNGGATIDADRLSVNVDDAYEETINTANEISGEYDLYPGDDNIGAGDSDELNHSRLGATAGNDILLNQSTVRVIFEEDGQSFIMAKWDGPDA